VAMTTAMRNPARPLTSEERRQLFGPPPKPKRRHRALKMLGLLLGFGLVVSTLAPVTPDQKRQLEELRTGRVDPVLEAKRAAQREADANSPVVRCDAFLTQLQWSGVDVQATLGAPDGMLARNHWCWNHQHLFGSE
jgi:hypothetical protein